MASVGEDFENIMGVEGCEETKFDMNGSKENGVGNVSMSDVIVGDGDEKGEGNVRELVEDCGFRVGDFVWAKVKSQPWWPGQVYDARDASEFAVKHSVEGCLLVAFFGDGSCSWRLPSQLVPFVENFTEMSIVDDGMSKSKSLWKAIRSAAEEVGRVVESNMICKCVALEERDGLGRLPVLNAGVKPGVLTPEVDVCRLSLPGYEADGILSQVMHFARDASVENQLELVVLRSWLSAFYRAKGGYRLVQWFEPLDIGGMEDEYGGTGEVLDDKFSCPTGVPLLGSQNDTMKSPESSRDKVNHRRKRKSVAKLMKENAQVKSRRRTSDAQKDGKFSTVMKRKRNDVEDEEGDSEEESSLEKPKESGVTYSEHDPGVTLDESEKEYTPRERKRSKYLCPPYTTLTLRAVGNSSSKKGVGYDRISPVGGAEDPNNAKKLSFEVTDVDIPVDEWLPELQCAAVNVLYLSRKGSLDAVWAFASAFRSLKYQQGADYKVFQKCKTGRKRKSLSTQLGDLENDLDEVKAASRMKTPNTVKAGRKPDSSRSKRAAEVATQKLGSSPSTVFSLDIFHAIRQKLDFMMVFLENHHHELSLDDKSSLQGETKRLLENVETISEKLTTMAENASS